MIYPGARSVIQSGAALGTSQKFADASAAASDYIELFARQDSGGNLNLFGASNTVIVARIL